MRSMLRYFLKVRRELKVLLFIAIGSYFIIELWLNNYQEIFNGAHQVGEFFSRLATAYVSAFIFYFIVIHIKTERDKHHINEFVGHEVFSIITITHLLIQPFQEKLDKNTRFSYLPAGELQQLLSKFDRKAADAPYSIQGVPATWLQWYEHLAKEMISHLQNIMKRYSHLDSRLIRLLTRIEHSVFFAQFYRLHDFSHDKTFGIFFIQMKFFLDHVKALEEYANKHLKEYQYLTGDFVGRM